MLVLVGGVGHHRLEADQGELTPTPAKV